MRKATLVLLALVLVTAAGCVHMPGGTDLSDVADAAGVRNVTTGDGTFENYTATGHYTGLDVGFAIGLPGLFKIMEVWPARSNEELLTDVAARAKSDGADAMINVTPAQEGYLGIPFGIFGLYVDRAEGTGIKAK